MWQDVRVQPDYGGRKMHVSWALSGGAAGEVFVYRSITGVGEWILLNETAPVPSAMGAFTDETYRPQSFNETPHYRLLLRKANGDKLASLPVAVFEDLTRMEKAACAAMIREELRTMQYQAVPILMFFPLYSGRPCPGVDPHSGQGAMFDCRDVPPDQDCYGQRFIGGFQPPVQTRMILENIGSIITAHDGTRKVSGPVNRVVRLLAFPRPRHECLIVQPRTDERYVIGDQVVPFAFKGVYPIAYRAEVQLLPKSDPRYRLPVPQIKIQS